MLTPHRRTGATLVELLVALVIFGLVGTTLLRTLVLTAHWLERTNVTADQRGQVDAAALVARTLLQAASPADGDILRASDTAVVFRAAIARGVACRIAGHSVWIPTDSLSSGITLGANDDAPQPGDSLAVFDEHLNSAAVDDRWTKHLVTAVSTSPGGCVGGPLADSLADATTPAWRLDVAPALTAVQVGAPAHVLRYRRLALYASLGVWALGLAETGTSGLWGLIQPVASPLLSPSTGPGLQFAWRDTLGGAALVNPAGAGLTVRAPPRVPLRGAAPAPVDSLGTTLVLRNAR